MNPNPPSEYLRSIARKGGQSKSPAKVAAVRANLAAANAARAARRAELPGLRDGGLEGTAGPRPRQTHNPIRRINKLPT
jgi:hypothetical protein